MWGTRKSQEPVHTCTSSVVSPWDPEPGSGEQLGSSPTGSSIWEPHNSPAESDFNILKKWARGAWAGQERVQVRDRALHCPVSNSPCCPAHKGEAQLRMGLLALPGGETVEASCQPTVRRGLISAWHPAHTASWPPNPLKVPIFRRRER